MILTRKLAVFMFLPTHSSDLGPLGCNLGRGKGYELPVDLVKHDVFGLLSHL